MSHTFETNDILEMHFKSKCLFFKNMCANHCTVLIGFQVFLMGSLYLTKLLERTITMLARANHIETTYTNNKTMPAMKYQTPSMFRVHTRYL